MLLMNLLKQLKSILLKSKLIKEYQYCKKVMKKHFNKNLTISEEEEQFQSSNACWICEKPIDNDDEKVGDHCHITKI